MDIFVTLNGLYISAFFLFYFYHYTMVQCMLAFIPFLINFFCIAPVTTRSFSMVNCIVNVQAEVVGKVAE